MNQKTEVKHDTEPKINILFKTKKEKADLEARNVLLQFDEVIQIISNIENGATFRLHPVIILNLHRIAIQDLYTCAGNYRTNSVIIRNTDHIPPPSDQVPSLMQNLCNYVNDNWDLQSPIHLSAYLLWKINWIHPFYGGNGRTARAASYMVLCSKLGFRLPGVLTVPQQIIKNRKPYYDALRVADKEFRNGHLNIFEMEKFLSALLARQLTNIHKNATKNN